MIRNFQDIAFLYSDKGKPALSAPYAESGIAFSVSHSGEAALLGFARNRPTAGSVWMSKRYGTISTAQRSPVASSPRKSRNYPACREINDIARSFAAGLVRILHQGDGWRPIAPIACLRCVAGVVRSRLPCHGARSEIDISGRPSAATIRIFAVFALVVSLHGGCGSCTCICNCTSDARSLIGIILLPSTVLSSTKMIRLFQPRFSVRIR
jgi:hypothetical protein